MESKEILADILRDVQGSKVNLKSIPILREKFFFKLLLNRKLRCCFYLFIAYSILYRGIGFRLGSDQVIGASSSVPKIFTLIINSSAQSPSLTSFQRCFGHPPTATFAAMWTRLMSARVSLRTNSTSCTRTREDQ